MIPRCKWHQRGVVWLDSIQSFCVWLCSILLSRKDETDMAFSSTHVIIAITFTAFSGLSIADVNVCVENGRKVIRSGPCSAGIAPKESFRSPAQPSSVPASRAYVQSNTVSGRMVRGVANPTSTYEQAGAANYQLPNQPVIRAPIYPYGASSVTSNTNDTLRPNAYGPGVHANQYGQAVTVAPDFGGVPGEVLRLNQNAYGPGVHMDQYGRPVREHQWGQ